MKWWIDLIIGLVFPFVVAAVTYFLAKSVAEAFFDYSEGSILFLIIFYFLVNIIFIVYSIIKHRWWLLSSIVPNIIPLWILYSLRNGVGGFR